MNLTERTTVRKDILERIQSETKTVAFYLLLNKCAETHRKLTSEEFLEQLKSAENDNWSEESVNKLIERYIEGIEETYLSAYTEGLKMGTDLAIAGI